MIAETIGYMGLVILLLSFMQGNIIRLRVLSIIGSIVFLIQAHMLGSVSLMLANLCFVIVHSYWIYKYKTVDKVLN